MLVKLFSIILLGLIIFPQVGGAASSAPWQETNSPSFPGNSSSGSSSGGSGSWGGSSSSGSSGSGSQSGGLSPSMLTDFLKTMRLPGLPSSGGPGTISSIVATFANSFGGRIKMITPCACPHGAIALYLDPPVNVTRGVVFVPGKSILFPFGMVRSTNVWLLGTLYPKSANVTCYLDTHHGDCKAPLVGFRTIQFVATSFK